ncbi:MAG TPA: DCC1-like thiol-disulfide oxidoreductase family protein, partial [Polyangiaceae bacterium]|nr:DCC1-like thiol-disulfide oxidoreductase family protein [Polyangiaceae bacterium]
AVLAQGPRPDLSLGPILLYDGSCGVCARSVQWILVHERTHSLRFAALESPVGQALRDATGISRDVDSLIWVEARSDQSVHGRVWSEAILSVLRYVGGPWRALSHLRIVPRPLRDVAYRLFAHYRLRLVARSCLVPSAEQHSRFLGN